MKHVFRRAKAKAKIAAIGSTLSLLGLPAIRRRAQEHMDHAGLILMFHHVAPRRPERLWINQGLEITPQTLERVLVSLKAQDYDIVPMDAVHERLAHRSGEKRFAALTFDDGGRDNLVHATPILQKYEAPFTVYVTTGFASASVAPWWHVIERAALSTRQIIVDTGQGVRWLDASSQAQKARTAEALHDLMWRADEDLRARLTAQLAAQAGFDLAAISREVYMDWDELRQMATLPGCTIGAHTLTHANLARLDDRSAMREIAGARDIIRERLGVEARHFAYPYGGPECCAKREFDFARKAGFATAVTTRRGLLGANDLDSLASLPRVPINGSYQSALMIDALVSGLPMALARPSSILGKSVSEGLKRPTERRLGHSHRTLRSHLAP